MTVLIETAQPSDAEIIHGFIVALAAYEKEPDAVEVTPAELREQLAADSPPFQCVIARRDGEPVGFALYFFNYSTWRGRPGLYLEDLFVLPACRGHGVGLALFRHLTKVAVSRGCARMEWSVLDWNTPAIDFYRSLGAQPMSGWTVWRLTNEALVDVSQSA